MFSQLCSDGEDPAPSAGLKRHPAEGVWAYFPANLLLLSLSLNVLERLYDEPILSYSVPETEIYKKLNHTYEFSLIYLSLWIF